MLEFHQISGVHIFPHSTVRKMQSRGRYQRFIIFCLATQLSSMTRLALAKLVAKHFGLTLTNGYNHVYVELSTSLIPNRIVEDDGSLPAIRGPKVIQKEGITCFRLTNLGVLAASVLDEITFEKRMLLLGAYLASENSGLFEDAKELIQKNIQSYPEFAFDLIKHGLAEFFDGRASHPLEIIPKRNNHVQADGSQVIKRS